MKLTSIIISSFAVCLISNAVMCQVSPVRPQRTLSYPVVYFTTNIAGELFTVGADNLLKKYNTDGDSVGIFNDVKRYGKLSYVEARNPWKTLLFYENFQTIVILDKYLKNLGSIRLSDRNIFNVKAVSTSYDNNIWVFDGREFKIKKINDQGELLMASNDLRQVFDDPPNPEWIGDGDGRLYLYDPEKGFYIFDSYGGFKSVLPFKNWKSIFITNQELVGFDDQHFYRYKPPVPEAISQPLDSLMANADLIGYAASKIFVLKNQRLSIYPLR